MHIAQAHTRARFGALVAITAVLVVLGTACGPRPAAGPSGGGGGPLQDGIVGSHNAHRAGAGLPQLAVDPGMNSHAQEHADRLAAGAGGACTTWHSGELGAWYAGHAAGENVGCVGPCASDSGRFMSMWLNSPGHRANVFNPAYHFIGVGASCNGRVLFAVVHFRS